MMRWKLLLAYISQPVNKRRTKIANSLRAAKVKIEDLVHRMSFVRSFVVNQRATMRSPTHLRFLPIGLFLLFRIPAGSSDESQSIVNGKKSLHKVDDKFISISVDPAILFSGIKLSSTSLSLATSLSPIYLRIAGPSTSFLSYSEDDSKATDVITESTNNIVFGPTKWWALNEWVRAANFTPVYAINDAERINEDWDPKSTLSLLEISSKMNVNCYWQLGYDARDKTQHGYRDDLKTLKHILDAFPGSKATWKTVGSDLSEFPTVTERQLDELQVDAVMWEPELMGKDAMHRLLSTRYSKSPEVWISAPKSGPIVSFDSALDWGVQIGEAAKNGFSVIFRQPRLQELFSDTPAYWISILHKHLMGRNVLEVKQTSLTPSKAQVYAHCSRNQNSYSVRGAMTVMMVNNQTQEHTSSLLVAGTQMKNLEVRSYILTSPSKDSMETLLNGEVISMQNLTQNRFDFKPKLRRAKAMTHLSLTIPGKSIGFFVLPGARIPVCVEEEDETNLILQEMDNAQGIDFPEEEKSAESIFSRINTGKPIAKLSDLYHRIEEEIEEDEKYYKRIQLKPFIKADDWKQSLLERVKENKVKTDEGGKLMLNKFDLKNVDLSNLKKLDLNKLDLNKMDMNKLDLKKVDLKNLLRKEELPKTKDIDLSSSEILRVLSDRAKARMSFNSPDFDELLEKVKSKIRAKRSARGGRGRGAGRRRSSKQRPKRDINMALLNLKTESDDKKDIKMKSKFNYDKKEATIRKSGVSSEEYEDDNIEDNRENKPTKIFAGFASVEEDDDLPDMKKVLPGLPMKPTKETSIKDLFSPELFSLDNNKDLFAFDSKPELFGKSKSELFFDSPKAKSSGDLFAKSSDLFGLEPQSFSKISLSNLPIFQHKPPPTSTVKTPKKKNFVDYVKDDQSEEKLEDLDELEDALNSYHGFHEAFGDDVSVVKGNDGYKDDLLASEFLINNYDNKDEVERTIKKLENFFNADESYESNFGRYRRDVSRYTEEDVDFYTKLMKGNILHMRNSIRERKRQDALKRLSGGDFFKSLLPPSTLLRSNLNRIDKDAAKPSPAILQDHQVRFLKNRLAHKKKLEELQSRLPKLDMSARFRRTRNADGVYVPSKANFSNTLHKSYESKLENMREWRDEDILLLPKPKKPTLTHYEKQEEKDIPMARNRIKVNKRLPRGAGYDSLENTIDGFVNYIKKEADFDEATNGEYSLTLPTKDALSIKQKNGNTDIKIHTENNDKGAEAYTCLATDLTTTTENPVTVGNDEDDEETTIYEEDDMEVIEIIKKPTKTRVSIDDGNVDAQFFNRMFYKVKDLIGLMHTSINNFFE